MRGGVEVQKVETGPFNFLVCNLQSQAATHTVLVIGLYVSVGNPTT